jgi:hypothetical protein
VDSNVPFLFPHDVAAWRDETGMPLFLKSHGYSADHYSVHFDRVEHSVRQWAVQLNPPETRR